MRRRIFIQGIAASAAWPFAAHAQQPDRMRRIGVMMGQAEDDREGRQEADALRKGLYDLGWIDGGNVRMDFHWDVGKPDRAQVIAKDIIAARPDVIVSHTSPATAAAFHETKSIPIVFVSVLDPIGLGLISSFAHPSGNVTGFTNLEPSMGGKWVEVLKDFDPRIRRVAILYNPATAPAGGKAYLPSFKAAGATLGVEAIEAPVNDAAGIERAVDALGREPGGGLIAMTDIFIASNRGLIIRLAANNRLPLVAAFRFFTDEGGLISYGANVIDLFRRAASYVDRILHGAKSAELPVQAPTKYETVVNLKTAKALGLEVPPSLLVRADELIE